MCMRREDVGPLRSGTEHEAGALAHSQQPSGMTVHLSGGSHHRANGALR